MNHKKLTVLGLIIICGLVLSACNLLNKSQGNESTNSVQSGASLPQPAVAGQGVVVNISESGAEPVNLTVKAGEVLTFVNKTNRKIQIGSDPHPTHTANSELTNGEFVTDLESGASANVTLNKVGAWSFHDHLNPTTKGKVTVQ